MYLVTSEQMRALDRRTMTTLRVPGLILMEHAGKEVAMEVVKRQPQRVVVLCGKGNNGGDGWVAARWLRHYGVPEVSVICVAPPADLTGDALSAAKMTEALGVPVSVYQPGQSVPKADVYVDALLGTGVQRPLDHSMRQLVEQVDESSDWTVSVDVPTGVDASTGEVPSTAIRADVTVAIGVQKLGTAIAPGCYYAGDVHTVDVGIDASDFQSPAEMVTGDWALSKLPFRSNASHKGSYGRVGIAVGPMNGAAVLAGMGAARIGAGLVVLASAVDLNNAPVEFVVRHKGMSENWPPFDDCQSVVIGPGLGAPSNAWWSCVDSAGKKGVIDADGLTLLAGGRSVTSSWVITPHPKECARLLGWTTERVQAERLDAAQSLAKQTGAVVLLKGYHSLIVSPTGLVRVNPTGDASLATAGSGDVLAGVIAGLIAQGLPSYDAAAVGAYIHGLAGELAGRNRSKIGVMATDVVENISRAIHLHFDKGPEE